MKKVLMHAPGPFNVGGKQNYLETIKKYLHGDVTYFFYGPRSPKESKLSFVRRFFGDYLRFYRLLKTGEYDVVQINTSMEVKSFFRDGVFALISRKFRVKTIVFWHGWRWGFAQKVIGRIIPYFKLTLGSADAMIVLAGELFGQLRSYGYKKPIFLETTFVEDSLLNTLNGAGILEAYQNTDREVVILFLSRVERAKGIYETIDSFQRLQAKYPNITLKIAGTGSELERVKRYVEKKGLRRIQFLGWVMGEEKLDVFHESDIYVLPSYSEGMPCALLEAMSCGLPIVTTDVGGIKDFFEPENMGAIVRMKDVSDLERQLEKLIVNPELIEQTGAYNARYAREHFAPELVAQRLEDIFEKTILGG